MGLGKVRVIIMLDILEVGTEEQITLILSFFIHSTIYGYLLCPPEASHYLVSMIMERNYAKNYL
jgi:hypothetical protein